LRILKIKSKKPTIKNEKTREKYFLENNIKCTCLVGYVVCNECYEFYNE